MIKLRSSFLAVIGACALLSACFTSEQPLFEERTGSPIFGARDVEVAQHGDNGEPDIGVLQWSHGAYLDLTNKKDRAVISFHPLPGTWPWDGWYVGQTQMSDETGQGYLYALFRKQNDKVLTYDISCTDLTVDEAQSAHLVRKQDGRECAATRKEDLAQALRLLTGRDRAKGYWTWKPAHAPAP